MKVHNPNCCGATCKKATGEVRVYPLGGGSNLIMCKDCFAHENKYRGNMRLIYGASHYPNVEWDTAEVYDSGVTGQDANELPKSSTDEK